MPLFVVVYTTMTCQCRQYGRQSYYFVPV